MTEPTAYYTTRLGIDHRRLIDDEYERLWLVEALHPDLSREEKVKFVLTGQPPEHLRPDFNMQTNPQKAHLFHEARTRRIARELGLENARLLPAQEDLIRQLATALDGQNMNRPLRYVQGKTLQTCRELVALLPRTVQALAWLNETADGRPACEARF